MKSFQELCAPENSELGKTTSYDSTYNPSKLFPILRQKKRDDLGIDPESLPFQGFDVWNHFEVSWLNERGKPVVALAKIIFPAHSMYLVESKSMKLYFNSFNNTQFKNEEAVQRTIKADLEDRIHSEVVVNIELNAHRDSFTVYSSLEGLCIDHLDISCSVYTVDPSLLQIEQEWVEEILCSNLLRSNCLVTGQPDWGSVQIAYTGKKINHASLLRYIVSFRNHTEFGEHCVERIFMDIMMKCEPTQLRVVGQYTRRGGIDINCIRSNYAVDYNLPVRRLVRQ